MISFAGINWIVVLVGVIVSNGLGFLWYGPLFGETWLRMIGKRAEDLEAKPSTYVITAVASAITMIVLAILVRAIGSSTLVEGALVGAVIWLGIGATASFVYTTFEGPPTQVWALYAAYQLVVYAVMGGLFAIWT